MQSQSQRHEGSRTDIYLIGLACRIMPLVELPVEDIATRQVHGRPCRQVVGDTRRQLHLVVEEAIFVISALGEVVALRAVIVAGIDLEVWYHTVGRPSTEIGQDHVVDIERQILDRIGSAEPLR